MTPDVHAQFLLDEAELRRELDRMTQHRTLAIFAEPSSEAVVVRSPVSRLAVDVERFPEDADEPMAARGMGAVYTTTSQLTPPRRRPSAGERALMLVCYRPRHARLEATVATSVERYGQCLVIGCHNCIGQPIVVLRSRTIRVAACCSRGRVRVA